eukprot:CAMPEP_0178814284 /NCGR_PEP_ID=MMETSP0746-20121128/213_1 /TAXON_ID=913974 /ORGANISM="Nitzschia punctata, Strain CCMP561" /LENGTH=188 /DNA_ID=CAMNT_0020475185 /DNA_START=408 /DNA_END=971 /DNA_ORIENTATION=-
MADEEIPSLPIDIVVQADGQSGDSIGDIDALEGLSFGTGSTSWTMSLAFDAPSWLERPMGDLEPIPIARPGPIMGPESSSLTFDSIEEFSLQQSNQDNCVGYGPPESASWSHVYHNEDLEPTPIREDLVRAWQVTNAASAIQTESTNLITERNPSPPMPGRYNSGRFQELLQFKRQNGHLNVPHHLPN